MDKSLDYILKLGLDTSQLKKANAEISKSLTPTMKKMEDSERKKHTLQNKTLLLKRKEIALAKRQVSIEKQIRAAEAKGARGFSRVRDVSGKGDIDSIAKAELLLKQKLLAFETRHRNEKKIQAEKKETLKIQERLNRAERRNNPDANISYQARTALQERVRSAGTRSYAVEDPNVVSRIAKAKVELKRLHKEITDTKSQRALIRMRIRYADIQREISSAVREQKVLNRAMSKGELLARKFGRSVKRSAMQFAGAYAVIGAAKNIYQTGKELDSMQASLLAASGGFEEAKKDFKFLESTSIELGKSLTTLVGGYNKVAIAGRTAGFSAEENKNIFMAASEASTAYGLSQERTNLVMLAFSQMINKGKVSMEEISRQLGETLPGGVALAAKSMGYAADSVGDFIAEVESGKLLTKDFIHNFSKTLREEVRLTGSLAAGKKKLAAEQQRLKASYESIVNEVFQSGGSKSIGNVFKSLSGVINKHRDDIVGLLGVVIDFTAASAELGITLIDGTLEAFKTMVRIFSMGAIAEPISFMISLFEDFVAIIYQAISGYSTLIEVLKTTRDKGIVEGGKYWIENAKATVAAFNQAGRDEHRRREDIMFDKISAARGNGAGNVAKIDKIEYNSYNSDPKQSIVEFETFMDERFSNLLSY